LIARTSEGKTGNGGGGEIGRLEHQQRRNLTMFILLFEWVYVCSVVRYLISVD
jgi:hypothetical protein